uniref:Possible methyltransferase n=1 Tax=Paulinella chromatophora TaxID=39717 RepID=B1X3X9_PAUCH|nr:possible methyltransferase [Paulinella chromatophora]ACB42648.1 possible methyltransferase [Paulinella chromatophora]
MASAFQGIPADAATRLVSAFYDRFPYPGDPLQDGPPPGYNWRWCYRNVVNACTGVLPALKSENLKILDAGCGTGVSTDYLCHLNPGSDILAIDISNQALEVARERLRRSKGASRVKRLRQEQLSLLDLKEDNYFHYINSVGVLHHLRNPEAGLKVLANSLVEGGLIHLFLYADGGRWEIHRIQQALKLMGVGSDDEGLRLGRQLFQELPLKNRLRTHHEQRWSIDTTADPNFADMYLHPQETSYNLSTLFNLVESSGLEFVCFSNPSVWDPSRLLSGELLKMVRNLPVKKQWALVEALDPDISHFEVFLSKGDTSHYSWDDKRSLIDATGIVNPCTWGLPSYSIMGPDLNYMMIEEDELTLIQNLQNSNSGVRFQELTLKEISSLLEAVNVLQSKGILMLSPTHINN